MPRTAPVAAPQAASSSSGSSSGSSSSSSSADSDAELAAAPASTRSLSDAEQAGDDDEEDEDDDEAAQAQADADRERRAQQADRKLGTKLHHLFRTVAAAVRRARTHELQRQIKRLKPLAAGSAEARAAEDELAALKALLPEPLAARALRSKLVKAKLLPRGTAPDAAEFPLLRHIEAHEALAAAGAAAAATGAAGKVEARVLSNKGLADDVLHAVDALRALVRPDEVRAPPKAAAAAPSEPRGDKGKGKEQAPPPPRAAPGFVPLGEAGLLEREWSGEEDEGDEEVEDEASGSEDEQSQDGESDVDEAEAARRVAALGDLSRFDAMLGGASDEEESADSAASSEAEGSARPAARQAASAAAAEPKKRKRSASPAASAKAGKAAKKGKEKAGAEMEPLTVGSSTFLPSLSSGFVSGRGLRLGKDGDDFSGSEGELSEIDEDAEERGKDGKKVERKNRRGQRERRAIWEKKYGRAANHVKLREKEARAATRVYDPTTPATRDASGARKRPAPFLAPGRVDGGWGGGVANSKPAPPRPTVPPARPPRPQQHLAPRPPPRSAPPAAAKQEQMHPSWIAKQKQKELAAQAAKGAIKAKKIVFD